MRGSTTAVFLTGAVRLGAFAEEDETSTGTTQSLVGGGGDNVAVLEGVVALLRCDETADVRNVGHQIGILFVSNLLVRISQLLCNYINSIITFLRRS